jgi:hypothetical protein
MAVDLAAGYCGERTAEAFLKRVGKDYPLPRVTELRRNGSIADAGQRRKNASGMTATVWCFIPAPTPKGMG